MTGAELKLICANQESDLDRAKEGDLVKVQIDTCEKPEWMVYEGLVDGQDSFIVQRIPKENSDILSWRSYRRFLQFGSLRVGENGIVMFNYLHRNLGAYSSNNRRYERAKELLINANNWRIEE